MAILLRDPEFNRRGRFTGISITITIDISWPPELKLGQMTLPPIHLMIIGWTCLSLGVTFFL